MTEQVKRKVKAKGKSQGGKSKKEEVKSKSTTKGKSQGGGSKEEVIEKCPKCGIGKCINNEQEPTSWECVSICDNCGYKVTRPAQTCLNCKKGKYILSEIQSTLWDSVYRCNDCGHEIRKPTVLSNVKEVAKSLNELGIPAAKTIYDVIHDFFSKRPSQKEHGLHEFYSQVDVKSEYVSDFITATKANRDAARLEPGNIKYDIYQSEYDRTKFITHEIYKSVDAAEKEHKATPHYQKWKQDVEPMMAKPRTRQNSGIPYGYKLIS